MRCEQTQGMLEDDGFLPSFDLDVKMICFQE